MADYDLIASTTRGGTAIDEIEFEVSGAPPATGYLLGRRSDGPQPLVIALHDERGDKASFLPDLEFLIGRSFICLSIDSPITRRASAERDPVAAFDSQYAITLAALDLFNSDPNIQGHHVALLGRGLGGEVAATVAARTDEIQVVVATGSLPNRSDFVESSPHPLAAGLRQFHDDQLPVLLDGLRARALVSQLDKASSTHWLLQVADDDDRFSDADRATIALGIPRAVQVEHIAHGRDLSTRQSQRSRVDFISRRCGLAV